MSNDVYEPREDSHLLSEQVELHAIGSVLDMGTGSGLQAITAAQKEDVTSVLAVDINPTAVGNLVKTIKKDKLFKISARYSDLFDHIKKEEKFDTIVCNPPYLPNEKKESLNDIALHGGPKGNEFIIKLLKGAKKHLNKNGQILLLFSKFSKPRLVLKEAKSLGFTWKKLAQTTIFFEDLYVYRFWK